MKKSFLTALFALSIVTSIPVAKVQAMEQQSQSINYRKIAKFCFITPFALGMLNDIKNEIKNHGLKNSSINFSQGFLLCLAFKQLYHLFKPFILHPIQEINQLIYQGSPLIQTRTIHENGEETITTIITKEKAILFAKLFLLYLNLNFITKSQILNIDCKSTTTFLLGILMSLDNFGSKLSNILKKQLKLYLLKKTISNYSYDNQYECPICLENNDQKLAILPCHPDHKFHLNCIIEEIKARQKCPICRSEFQNLSKLISWNLL